MATKPATSKEVKTTVVSTETGAESKNGAMDLSFVLIRPHVTEKATDLAERGNVYAFEINKRANKMEVKLAVEKYYKVKPIKIAIINGKTKTMRSPRTGKTEVKSFGKKKALVYLKKGDKIDFV